MYQKFIAAIILTAGIFNFSCLNTYALETNIKAKFIKQKNSEQAVNLHEEPHSETEEVPIIPEKLEKEMKISISKIYGSENVNEIYTNIENIVKKAKQERSQSLKEDDWNRKSDWYKDEVIYMFYADQFGVQPNGKPNTFKTDIKMLDYLKELGVTTLYILPFADSPMGDAGFDVKDPRNVRADLGGLNEWQQFAAAARAKGFKLKADLVLNHFSDQHQWFQDILKGDTSKINYFVVREQMPEYTTYKDEKLGLVAEYKEPSGKISKRRQIFPEITENNYRKVTIDGKDYYFYHTFYPFQLDINWENPEVLYYCLETIAFWANQGIDIFRMDAIPYLIKEDGTDAENLSKTHRIIKLLSEFLQAIAPRSVIQAEACQQPNKILPYFGNDRNIKTEINGREKDLTRTDEVQIAYHFPYMPAIWASLISADNSYFWKTYHQTPQIPSSASWGIFLRVHDELTLEMVNAKTRELIYDDLALKGVSFRKGYGVSGRLASFLDNNPDRIGMAFSILMSMPGIPIIYYGDEIGITNNYANAKKSAKMRENKQKSEKNPNKKVEMLSYFDSRDINRGPVAQQKFTDAAAQKGTNSNRVYERVKKLIAVRKQNPVMSRGTFVELKTESPEVFAYVREIPSERIVVINNLSESKIKATVNFINDDFGKKSKDIYLKDMLSDKMVRAKVQNKQLTVRLDGYDAMWLKL